MADSDDEMPPLEYVGTGVTGGNPVTASIEPDDDMPPLEYVGTDASLGISLREGDRVILKGLSKAALNGQTGTLQSFQKASKGRLPVKLDSSGSMLAVKPENIQKLPRETVTTKATKMNPDFGVATAKATHADRNATYSAPDEDDELPPLEYVGTCDISSRPNGVSNDAKVEDDEMPSLEYFGSKPPRIGGAEGCTDEKTKEEMPENSTNSSNSTFRDGDQVLIKGTLTELDGQQGVIESIRDGSFQVKLERNHKNVAKLAHGKLLQNLAEANLHKIWLRGSGAGAMPPLQFVGQASFAPQNRGPAVTLQVVPFASPSSDCIVVHCNMHIRASLTLGSICRQMDLCGCLSFRITMKHSSQKAQGTIAPCQMVTTFGDPM